MADRGPRLDRPLRRLPGSRRAPRVSAGKELRRASSARRNERGGVHLLFEQRRARFAKLTLALPCLLPAKSPARLLGPCEDGSGCDDDEGAYAPAPRTSGTGRCAAGAYSLFAGPLVAALFSCSDSPGTMDFCQENNELRAVPDMLYKYSCR